MSWPEALVWTAVIVAGAITAVAVAVIVFAGRLARWDQKTDDDTVAEFKRKHYRRLP